MSTSTRTTDTPTNRAQGNQQAIQTESSGASRRRALAQMLAGNQVQQALYVAARLGIAELLAERPRSASELAQASGAHPDGLHRLMRVLSSFGVFAETPAGNYELTALGELLSGNSPSSMKALALWSGGVSYRAFGGLESSVRSGEPAFETIFQSEFFEYLERSPVDSELFDDLMAWNSNPLIEPLSRLGISDRQTLVDVGGGRGDLLAALLNIHPQWRGVLVDGARSLSSARHLMETARLTDRCEIVCSNILVQPLPVAALYLVKSVVHGLNDDQARRLLMNCRRSMSSCGRVWLIELALAHGNEPSLAKLMDLLMLVGCRGRERTEAEYRSLAHSAALRVDRTVPLKNGFVLFELVAMD